MHLMIAWLADQQAVQGLLPAHMGILMDSVLLGAPKSLVLRATVIDAIPEASQAESCALHFRASKSAQNQLSKCMAIEFARRKQNIAVVMLHPGTVDTDLSQPFQKVQTALFFSTSLCTASSYMQLW